jgi:hypothetical protein
MAISREKSMRRRTAWLRSQVSCGDYGCGECQVCRYVNFREWAEGCAPAGSTIYRDRTLEAIAATGVATFNPN